MSALSTCLHSKCLGNICGKKREKNRGKNQVSCIVATFKLFTGKERGQETKKHTGLAWKNAALVGEGRRSRMQLPWYFIHQLIYGLHTALNSPRLSLRAWAPGSDSIVKRLKQEDRCVGETSSIQFIDL